MDEYIILGKIVSVKGTQFRTLEQLILPLLAGGIGGLITILLRTIEQVLDYGRVKKSQYIMQKRDGYFYRIRLFPKFVFIGAIAGFAAVALLNPQGDKSQVSVLALLAGLSGISYLSRNALVDGKDEAEMFNKRKSKSDEDFDVYKEYSGSESVFEDLDGYFDLDNLDEDVKGDGDDNDN
jgi:hypothetical protein